MLKKIAAAFAAACFMISAGGCTAIPDKEQASVPQSGTQTEPQSSSQVYSEQNPSEFEIEKKDFLVKLNAEGGVLKNAETFSDGDFDGRGYVHIAQGGSVIHAVVPETPQHYRFVIAARSAKGASVSLKIKGSFEGVFYVSASEVYEGEAAQKFRYFAVESVYLTAAETFFELEVIKGEVDIDYILVENSEAVEELCYRTGTSAAAPHASLGTIGVMRYLTDIYGKNSLTAVNCTLGTNAEIDAVYNITGRYPAIRGSELAYVLSDDKVKTELFEQDLSIMSKWLGEGGLALYKWHWLCPNALRSADAKSFSAADALSLQNLDEIAVMDIEQIKMMTEQGYYPEDILLLAQDVDTIAGTLRRIAADGRTILFEPIPDGDSGLFWWGESADIYKKLYKFVFNRIAKKHRLGSVVFIFNGSDYSYFPGADYVDIIGQSFFEGTNSALAGRFSALADGFTTRKPLAITSQDVLTSPDLMKRDNAVWLFCTLESGEYLITENGNFSPKYNPGSVLDKYYNSTLFITRDELPDLKNYILDNRK